MSQTPQTPLPPLAGVRVLDLTRLLPGGYASQMLADLGADVLKIEEPGAGDYARAMPPFTRTVGQAFLAVNRNKRSAALNLKHPDGREALLRLVDSSDVLLESFRPGVMARLGLDYETLHARNPRLVVCAISGYGQDGPYNQRAGHDLNYIGYAGLLAHLARRCPVGWRCRSAAQHPALDRGSLRQARARAARRVWIVPAWRLCAHVGR